MDDFTLAVVGGRDARSFLRDSIFQRAAPQEFGETARSVSPYSFTVLRAKNRFSSSTAMVMWREARHTAISLASIFRRNVLSLILSMAAAS